MEQVLSHSCGCGHHVERATQILSDEHRVIERVLTALDELTRRPVVESAAHWEKALEFFRNFADKCHHFKEEKVLFPAMEEQGIPADGGPIGMMLMEHEQGRAYVRAMSACIARVQSQDRAAIDSLLGDAKAYIRLLREHIQKEDEILFPMADNVIPPDEHKHLLNSFAEHEAVEMGAQTHERYLEIARQLESAVRS